MANSGQRPTPAEANWNILQAIAWIVGHDEELIARASDRAENPLRGAVFDGLLVARHRHADHQDAEEELRRAAEAEEIHALGRANGNGRLEPIPGHEWHGLEFSHPIDAAPFARPTIQSDGATRWHDIVFPAQEVMARWPEPMSAMSAPILSGEAVNSGAPRAPVAKTNTSGAYARCRNWLMHQMEASETRPHPKSTFRSDCIKEFGLSVRQFNRAWDDAIEQTGRVKWRLPGRPAKAAN